MADAFKDARIAAATRGRAFILPRAALVAGLSVVVGLHAAAGRAAADDLQSQYPLDLAKLAIRESADAGHRVRLRARWRGAAPTLPAPRDALLRIRGEAGEGDTGFLHLAAGAWRAGRRTLRYSDPLAGAGGIQSVALRVGNTGGVVKIKGGGERWVYGLARPQSRVTVALEIGLARWCAVLDAADLGTNRPGRLRGRSRTAPASCGCGLSSTWEALREVSFVAHACTQVGCHGTAAMAGNLDLRPAFAYRSLVGVPSSASPDVRRVEEGAGREASMLWRKLAARTLGLAGVPGTSMPIGDPPFSVDELEALALWIESGAPEVGVIPETGGLLGLCLEPAGPP
jgi:hypothetical protein